MHVEWTQNEKKIGSNNLFKTANDWNSWQDYNAKSNKWKKILKKKITKT